MNPEDRELLDRLLDGDLPEPEEASLVERLEKDPEAMAWFAQRALLHTGLHTSLRRRSLQHSALVDLRHHSTVQSKLAWIRLGVGMAAASVFAAGLLWLNTAYAGVRVEILASRDCPQAEFREGMIRRLKTLELAQGNLHLRLPSGVSLEISSPATLNLLDPMHVRLLNGRVTADVGDRGKGFVMETPQARLVDRGTRFGVDASDPLRTDVIVLQGKVEVYDSSQKDPKTTPTVLKAGNAVSVVQRRVSRIVSISGTGGANEWSARTPNASDTLVSEVRDNLTGDFPSLYNHYRIVPKGLQERTLAYADRADEWHSLPPELVGADLIRTFNVDSFNWWLKVSLTLQRPCTVYVFAYEKNPVPEWLSAEFENTGQTIALDVFDQPASVAKPRTWQFCVWKKEVSKPGELVLGHPYADPPADRKSFRPSRMYGIAVRANSR
ncbi:MAG: hypothetical protein RLZZ399_643 [Verrucomicrobiota bacterium]|jgi:hypothetical protein